jgi:hypothetical protein
MHALLADGQDPRMGAHSETTIDRRRWKIGLTFVRILSCNRSRETASRVIRAIDLNYVPATLWILISVTAFTISSALLSHFISLGICAAALADHHNTQTSLASHIDEVPGRRQSSTTLC